MGRRPHWSGLLNRPSPFFQGHVVKFHPALLLAVVIFVGGLQAASIQKDNVGVPVDPKDKVSKEVVVSATLNSDLSSEYFGYFDVTLENKSDKWLTISKVRVTFQDSFQNENIRFVTGPQFGLWQSAMKKIIAIDQQNKETALATVAALGYGLAALSGNKTLQAVGTTATVGAVGAYGISQYNRRIDSLENTKMFPENHLLGDSIRIPPGLFVDRWLLVNSRSHDQMAYVTTLNIEMESTDGALRKLVLTFRPKKSTGYPKWQRTIFDKNGYNCTSTSSQYSTYGGAGGCN
jgi:hypothetical protein